MKTCIKPDCKQINPQPLDRFYKHPTNIDGLSGSCKTCYNLARLAWNRNNPQQYREGYQKRRLKLYFNMSIEQYNELLTKQNNCCAICGKNSKEFNKLLAVDHDHETGEVRGLLCSNCNTGIGMLQDSTKLLDKAKEYLKK